jgi:Skp family chaperone for outer membrane proteins
MKLLLTTSLLASIGFGSATALAQTAPPGWNQGGVNRPVPVDQGAANKLQQEQQQVLQMLQRQQQAEMAQLQQKHQAQMQQLQQQQMQQRQAQPPGYAPPFTQMQQRQPGN